MPGFDLMMPDDFSDLFLQSILPECEYKLLDTVISKFIFNKLSTELRRMRAIYFSISRVFPFYYISEISEYKPGSPLDTLTFFANISE